MALYPNDDSMIHHIAVFSVVCLGRLGGEQLSDGVNVNLVEIYLQVYYCVTEIIVMIALTYLCFICRLY